MYICVCVCGWLRFDEPSELLHGEPEIRAAAIPGCTTAVFLAALGVQTLDGGKEEDKQGRCRRMSSNVQLMGAAERMEDVCCSRVMLHISGSP